MEKRMIIEYKNSSRNGLFSDKRYHKEFTIPCIAEWKPYSLWKLIIEYKIENVWNGDYWLAKKWDYHLYVIWFGGDSIASNRYTDYYIVKN